MKVTRIREVELPTRGTSRSAGFDFYVPDTYPEFKLVPGEDRNIPSGLMVNVPKGFALVAFEKSGQATKKNIQVGAKVVDEDYQGEVHLHIRNTGNHDIIVSPGEKIVQFILIPMFYDEIEEVVGSELYEFVTERSAGGFGSTGIK